MDISHALQDQIRSAVAERRPLRIHGSGSKDFYGRPVEGETLAVAGHRDIVNYQAAELILTARCGTPLEELEQCLAAQGQMLPFEPPRFGPGATLGGAVACGLSGPRRPYAGALRDFILGARCINGRGEILRFGGEVVKNVAGFDAARLMAGALGTLGVLLDISLKILPRPAAELTLAFEMEAAAAIGALNRWAARPLPLSAGSHGDGLLRLRLSGAPAALEAAHTRLGGEVLSNGADYWRSLREHELDFFRDDRPLWRISLPPAAPPLPIVGDWHLEWGGAQRWLKTALRPAIVRATTTRAGGHATLFRNGAGHGAVFHPLAPALLEIHKRLKAAFDPHRILNPGRLYPEV
ncbi:MAG: glycolate oxidase subunit GlcE [Gammaproteobacteria bacterium]